LANPLLTSGEGFLIDNMKKKETIFKKGIDREKPSQISDFSTAIDRLKMAF